MDQDDTGIGEGAAAPVSATRSDAPLPPKRRWGYRPPPAEITNIRRRYDSGEALTAIARARGLSLTSLCRYMDAAGIERREHNARKVPLNEAAFSEITEESAYWAGFLMADGTVSRPGGRVGQQVTALRIAEVDREHVERFRRFLGFGGKITTFPRGRTVIRGKVVSYATPAVGVGVTSNRIARDLGRFGVSPGKTGRECVRVLERKRHFWRGYVDGDGTVRMTGVPSHRWPALKIIGSERVVQQFCDYVRTVVPTTTVKPHPHGSGANAWVMDISSWTAAHVVSALYNDSTVALPRKMVRASEVLKWAGERGWPKDE